jgi:hypothetical protein
MKPLPNFIKRKHPKKGREKGFRVFLLFFDPTFGKELI